MYEELKAHNGKGVFFTLTYDDNNVPKNYLYYATATDYAIFRSPTDYGYDNTFTDEKGRERVLPSCGRERKHNKVVPYKELQDLGIDTSRMIDFNIKRQDGIKFREQIQDIYGNYLRTFNNNDTYTHDTFLGDDNDRTYMYDFDTYKGDDFADPQVVEPTQAEEIVLDLFTDYLNDEDFEKDTQVPTQKEDGDSIHDVVTRCELDFGKFRERPIMVFNSVRKKDVQDWIKRARRRREYAHKKKGQPLQDFTFFVTAEYGPRTLRPHYHGCLFGVTADETRDMMKDWQRHHGVKISWDNIDLSKGDMSYCAKYCSKGFFEHPLCSKDFFYMHPNAKEGERPFTEYHSKHYERCLEIFNVDEPIVDAPFKLISKGLGVSWVDEHQDLVADFQDIDFVSTDTEPTIKVAYTPDVPLPFDDDYDAFIEKYGKDYYDRQMELLYDLTMLKYIDNEDEHILKRKITELKTKDYAECIEKLFQKFHYYRTYKKEVVAYGVPKYYRAKILSDGLRPALTNFIQQTNVELYQEKLRQLQTDFPDREDAEIVSMLESQEEKEKCERMNNIYAKLKKQYNKSKI